MNYAVITLGSNLESGKEYLEKAISIIAEHCEQTHFSEIYKTEPEGRHKQSLYYNCVAEISTQSDFDSWENFAKTTEKEFGRTRENSEKGIISLDIDIVIWNKAIIRPQNLRMNFMLKGIHQLASEL